MNYHEFQFECIKKNNVIAMCVIANLFIGQFLIASYEPSTEVLDVIETISERMSHDKIPFDNQGLVAVLERAKHCMASCEDSSFYKNLFQDQKAKIDKGVNSQKDLDLDSMISVINKNPHIQFKQRIQENRSHNTLNGFCKYGSNLSLEKAPLYWKFFIDLDNQVIQEIIHQNQFSEQQNGLCNLK